MLQRLKDRSYDAGTNVTGFSIKLDGVVRVGNRVTATKGGWAYYRYSPTSAVPGKAKAQLNFVNLRYDDAGNSHADSEIIEDGKTMWLYNPPTKTYSASNYDLTGPNAATSDTYVSDALTTANSVSPATGGPSYAIRLLNELFATKVSYTDPSQHFYHPLIVMPGGPASGVGPYKDLLTGLYRDANTGLEALRRPTRNSDYYYIVYQNSLNGNPTKVIAFEIYVDPSLPTEDPDRQTIRRIYLTESSPVSITAPVNLRGKTNYTSWTIQLKAETDFSGARFTPIAPSEIADWSAWRPIVASSPVRN